MPKPKSRVTMRKSTGLASCGGDDLYSWAVFVDGRLKWNGMSKSEATWRRDRERREFAERSSAKKGEI